MSQAAPPSPSSARLAGAIDPARLQHAEQLDREQFVPRPLSEVFPFFADAHNLEQLTPSFLNFSILTPQPIQMQAGTLIDYRIKLYGVPMRWRTLISAWEPPYRFVDEQIRGPYSIWWHEHTFAERDGGTVITDRVRFRSPLSALTHPMFIRDQLQRIFAFRYAQIEKLLGTKPR